MLIGLFRGFGNDFCNLNHDKVKSRDHLVSMIKQKNNANPTTCPMWNSPSKHKYLDN